MCNVINRKSLNTITTIKHIAVARGGPPEKQKITYLFIKISF